VICRPGCGACCVAPSLSSIIPGLGRGKRAGEPCPHLSPDYGCLIYNSPKRPAVCASLQASAEMCGRSRDEALAYLTKLERITAPHDPTTTLD
jgi:hypothetical protein